MYSLKYSLLTIIIISVSAGFQNISAQGSSDSTDRIEELRKNLKSEPFNLGALILAQGDFGFDKNAAPGTRGFTVSQVRFKLNGKLDGGFSYKIQADFADQFTLLDAEIGYDINDRTQVIVGSQQPGISYEFLTAPHRIDFYTRSITVVALAQERDFGVRLAGDLRENAYYNIGIFNGNGLAPNNDNNFYYAGRLGYKFDNGESGSVDGGINLSYGKQDDTSIAGGILPNIDGDRLTYGGDIRFENENIILATEVLGADLDYTGFTESDNVFGFHVTGGYKIDNTSTIFGRYETLQSDLLGAGVDQDRILVGYKGSPTAQTGYRVNYLMPLNDGADFMDHGIVLTMHIGF